MVSQSEGLLPTQLTPQRPPTIDTNRLSTRLLLSLPLTMIRSSLINHLLLMTLREATQASCKKALLHQHRQHKNSQLQTLYRCTPARIAKTKYISTNSINTRSRNLRLRTMYTKYMPAISSYSNQLSPRIQRATQQQHPARPAESITQTHTKSSRRGQSRASDTMTDLLIGHTQPLPNIWGSAADTTTHIPCLTC